MHFGLDQILPSLQSFGMWSYWIIGLASALEAFFITGIILPGTLVVDAGGILVERGFLDYFDLVWFVAIGSFIGGEMGYGVGVLGARGLSERMNVQSSPHYKKAERLFRRHGGLALVIGRFLGPVSGLVSFAAALSGMPPRRFALWNMIGAFPYALSHVALGYFLGDALFKLGPFATRVALFALAVSLVLVILWYLIIRIERLLPLGLTIIKTIIRAITANPDVRIWAGRHPRLSGFLANRFDASRFQGLTTTLLATTFLYVLIIWIGTVFDFLMAEPIVQVDTQLANLIHEFWNPWLLRIFAHITAMGDWRIVALIYVGIGVALWLRHQRPLMLGLSVALAGNVVSVAVLKMIFHRPRPELAYFVETSGSYPSGHAAISVAFYAMLFYIAWRRHLLGPILAAILAVTLAFLIGFSRLYLIEHYLSDILNGYLVGALWLMIGIALAEWWRETRSPETAARSSMLLSTAVVICALVAAGWINITYDKARNIRQPTETTKMVSDIPAIFTTGRMPELTVSITGAPLEPVNLIIVAANAAILDAAMKRAGWVKTEKPGVASLIRTIWAAWRGQEDKAAPLVPYFWAGQPNGYAFRKTASGKNRRHHARFWKTRYITPDGGRIFAGTASLDQATGWGVARQIDPDIDAERNKLIADLKAAERIRCNQSFALSPPYPRAAMAGHPWFTDGKAEMVWIRPD